MSLYLITATLKFFAISYGDDQKHQSAAWNCRGAAARQVPATFPFFGGLSSLSPGGDKGLKEAFPLVAWVNLSAFKKFLIMVNGDNPLLANKQLFRNYSRR